MRLNLSKVLFLIVSAVTLLALGCNGLKLPQGMPELVPCKVAVTQEGKPLEGARVQLVTEAHGYVIDGLTGADGVAVMKTSGSYTGAPAGTYKALVTKSVPTPSKFGEDVPSKDDERATWEKNRANEYRPTHSYVDKKYAKAKTSDLSASVDKANAEVKLEVGKAVDDITIPADSAKKPH